jgi:hypothetical protein
MLKDQKERRKEDDEEEERGSEKKEVGSRSERILICKGNARADGRRSADSGRSLAMAGLTEGLRCTGPLHDRPIATKALADTTAFFLL